MGIDFAYMADLDRDAGESTGQAKQRMVKELKGLIFLNPERNCPDERIFIKSKDKKSVVLCSIP